MGVNCFYDMTRFADRWLSSRGAGLGAALLLAGHDALDLNLNWYGDLAGDQFATNEYRNDSFNVDLSVEYSHQLFDRGPDLRLYATAYNFDDGTGVSAAGRC